MSAALAEIYDGRPRAVGEHLKRACGGFTEFRLFGTVFAHDCCHAYLLLGQPDMVEPCSSPTCVRSTPGRNG